MIVRLIRTKLNAPQHGIHLIMRQRLLELLPSPGQSRLLLVRAPAGYGKTIVMAQWWNHFRAQGVRSAWLTLDESENDLWIFLSYLLTAFKNTESGHLPKPTESNVSGSAGTSASALLQDFLDKIASIDYPFVLFLDEFELIENPAVLIAVRQILNALPPCGLMVVGCRGVPDLGLAKLRAQDLLTEVTEKELRFTKEEATEYLLRERGLALDSEDIELLHRYTEGWPAGFQLAALACREVEDQKTYVHGFSGTFAEIADYLAEDVFLRQPLEVQDFLLRTCILTRLTGPLCDAVTGRTDSHGMLHYLDKKNLFISPLDEQHNWYRYHKLFIEFLSNRLDQEAGLEPDQLHRVAADWFLNQGDPLSAAEHAMAAGDTDRVADIMGTLGDDVLFKTGQVSMAIQWVERLSLDAVSRYPKLLLVYCLALANQHRHEDVEAVLDRMSASEQVSDLTGPEIDAIQSIRAVNLLFQDRVEEARQIAKEALAGGVSPESIAYETLHNVLGFALVTEGRYEERTLLVLLEARKAAQLSGSAMGAAYAACWEGQFEMAQGHLKAAVVRLREARKLASEAVRGYSTGAAIAAVFLAAACYEQDELAEAEHLITGHLALLGDCGSLDVLLIGYITLAKIYALRGEPVDAQLLLDEVERRGREWGLQRVLATVSQERIRLALKASDIHEIEQRVNQWHEQNVGLDQEKRCLPANDPETAAVTRIRLMFYRRQYKQALASVKSELHKARDRRRLRQALLLQCLEAEVLNASGDKQFALRTLRRALKAGSTEGFIRTFADEWHHLAPLIKKLYALSLEGPASARSSLPARYLERIFKAAGEPVDKRREVVAGVDMPYPMALEEPVTKKEVAIVQLLAEGISNQQMADRLCIAESTVRYHLRNLNAKLGSKNRTQALVIARRLGIVPR